MGGWNVTRQISVKLPEVNTSFLDKLNELGIDIPEDETKLK